MLNFAIPLIIPTVHSDSGFPIPRSSTSNVQFNIIDENNNKPKFARPTYLQAIPESAGIGSFVLQVQATDLVWYALFSLGFGLVLGDNKSQ